VSTYCRERGLLVGLLDIEETVKEQELEHSRDPLVLLGNRVVAAKSETLIQGPVSSVLKSLDVRSEQSALSTTSKRVDAPVVVLLANDHTLQIRHIIPNALGAEVAHDRFDKLGLGDLVKVGSTMLAYKLR
jgi:hypothetical protein